MIGTVVPNTGKIFINGVELPVTDLGACIVPFIPGPKDDFTWSAMVMIKDPVDWIELAKACHVKTPGKICHRGRLNRKGRNFIKMFRRQECIRSSAR